eukprot:Phypoly_transcript_15374.p1 GENE.Phypoly_transcript_15374~~Phypoly_transcript_15374.p1  ORF type:complete len:168 (+),score=18.63 Phypoly_transcript_15374:308-811(+)
MILSLVVAASQNNVIGRGGQLPWRLPAELAHFRNVTTNHHILMGRKTWDSIPKKPLPNRVSIVLTSQDSIGMEESESLKLVKSLDQGIDFAKHSGETELMIIGGEGVFKQALPLCNKMYFTRVHANVEGDVFFPEIEWDQWQLLSSQRHTKDSDNEHDFSIEIYQRK